MKYEDKELLDWIDNGDDGNILDNIQAVEWQLFHHSNLNIREAIARCIDPKKDKKD